MNAQELKSVIVRFGVDTKQNFAAMLNSIEAFAGTVDEIDARKNKATADFQKVEAEVAALEKRKAALIPECKNLEGRVEALKKAIAAVTAVSL